MSEAAHTPAAHSEHMWIDITTLGDERTHEICESCGEDRWSSPEIIRWAGR